MTAKSGTGCLPEGTKIELFRGDSMPIEAIPVLWHSNIDAFGNRILQFGHLTSTLPVGQTNVVQHTDLQSFEPTALRSIDGNEVFPIYIVVGTEHEKPITIQCRTGKILEVTEYHPIKTSDDTLTLAKCLNLGNTITSVDGVEEIEDLTRPEKANYPVYNIGVGSRNVFELFRHSLITLSDERLQESLPKLDYVIATGIVEKVIDTLENQGKLNHMGLKSRDHIIFADHFAVGSYTLQHLLVGHKDCRFVRLEELSSD